jgi:hypothetical protein
VSNQDLGKVGNVDWERTCIERAEIIHRVHGGLLRVVQFLSLRTSAENKHGTFIAAKLHLGILTKTQKLEMDFEVIDTGG